MATDRTGERRDALDFAPRKHFRTLLLPFIALSAFVVFGAVVSIADPGAGIAVVIFFGALLVLMYAQGAGWWTSYRITETELFAHRWWKKRSFPVRQISEVREMAAEEVQARLQPFLENEAEAVRSLDPVGTFQSRRTVGVYTTYCSVPIMFTEKRRGGPLNIVSVGSKTRGRFVEISLRNEERFVLSPLDVDGFVTALREAMQATGQ